MEIVLAAVVAAVVAGAVVLVGQRKRAPQQAAPGTTPPGRSTDAAEPSAPARASTPAPAVSGGSAVRRATA